MSTNERSRPLKFPWQEGVRFIGTVAIVAVLAGARRLFIHRQTPQQTGGWTLLSNLSPQDQLHVGDGAEQASPFSTEPPEAA